jgi:hypothetical protein
MDIKEFTRDTIQQIIEGANEANSIISQYGAKVNSNLHDKTDLEISFDIAVTVVGTESAELGGKIQIAQLFKIGATGNETTSNQQVSRIQYKIPVKLPIDQEKANRHRRNINDLGNSI